MSSEALTTGAIGWFGKLPAAGDFLRRGLPDHFVEMWDAWLQAGMAAAALEHGENWQDIFLRFPVWFFLRRLPASDEEQHRFWAGLLVPSVDRVGRLFPLTVAFDMPASAFLRAGIAPVENRLSEIEALTLHVLGDDDLAAFEKALGELVLLTAGSEPVISTPSCLIEQLGRQVLLERLAGHALFWMAGTQSPLEMLMLPEPLQADAFGKLMLPSLTPELSD